MKRTRHSAEQIIAKLREADAMLAGGKTIAQAVQALGVSEQTLHRWRHQYGRMKASDARRLKELEHENGRLKKIVADQALDIAMLKEVAAAIVGVGHMQRLVNVVYEVDQELEAPRCAARAGPVSATMAGHFRVAPTTHSLFAHSPALHRSTYRTSVTCAAASSNDARTHCT